MSYQTTTTITHSDGTKATIVTALESGGNSASGSGSAPAAPVDVPAAGPLQVPMQMVSAWLSDFEASLSRQDFDAAAALFAEGGYWRDLLSYTWNLKTVEGRADIQVGTSYTSTAHF